MSQDVWYEGGAAQLFSFTDSGTFTLHGAMIGAQDPAHGGVQQSIPSVQLNNFNGSVTLAGTQLQVHNSIGVQGTGANTSFLALGVQGPSDLSTFYSNTAPGDQAALIASRQAKLNAGSVPVADQTNVSSVPAFLRQMLTQTRQEQAHAFPVLSAGITDARLYRVSASQGQTGIELDASGPSSTAAPVISAVASSLTGPTTATITWTTNENADSQVEYGTSTSYGTLTALNLSTVVAHSAALTGLAPGTLYHYRVRSRSLSGYVSVSADNTFSTPPVFVTGYSLGAVRNNFSGWVGTKFTTGPSIPAISALGRMCLTGNSASHTVKLVRASDGTDIQGGAVAIAMASCAPGTFVYGNLSAPVTLSANTAYYLVSQEVSGGDQWYDVSSISTTNVASVAGAVYWANNWVLAAGGSLSYVPVDFKYSIQGQGTSTTPPSVSIIAPAGGTSVSGNVTISANATDAVAVAGVQFIVDGSNFGAEVTAAPYTITWNSTAVSNSSHSLGAIARNTSGKTAAATPVTVTVSNSSGQPAGSPLLTGFSPSALRNNFAGWVGMQFKVGATALTVGSLGRLYAAGNTGAHVVKLARVSDGADIPGASVTISLPSGAGGQFLYGQLASPVTLAANTAYYLVSQEVSGGDQWYDVGPVTPTSAASVTGGVYWSGTSWVTVASTGTSYVPVNLLYTAGTAPPAVSITAPAANATVSGRSVTVSATATAAAGLSIANVQFKIDGANVGALDTTSPYSTVLDATTLVNGAHTLTAVASDSAGRSITAAAVSITVNNPAPTISITAPAANATVSGASVAVTASAAAGSGLTITSVQFKIDGANLGSASTASPYSATLDTTKLINGAHSLTATATDSAGNATTSAAAAITVKNAAPTVAITAPAAGATVSGKSVAVTATAQAGAGLTIAGIVYKIDGTSFTPPLDSTALTNGAHSLTAIATDSAGASTTSAPVSVTVKNNAAPTVAITAPIAGATIYGKSVAVTATAQAGAGLTIAGIVYKIDGASFTPPLDTTALTNGAHSLTAIATDSAGASTTSAPVSVTVKNNAAPTVAITAPIAGATIYGKSVAVTATAQAGTGLTITGIVYKIDNTSFTPPLDSTTVADGAHSLTAIATDSAGASTTSAPVSVTVKNNAAPTVAITAPIAGATIYGKSVAVTATAQAGTGLTITGIVYKIDNASFTPPLDSTTVADGAHSLTAIATDSAGASTTSAPVSIAVSNAAPTVSITAPSAGATVSGKSVTVTATGQAAAGLTITGIAYKIDAASFTPPLDTTALTNGPHTLTAAATDSAGHTGASAPLTINVNNAPPPAPSTPFITGQSPGALRNNFPGFAGMQFTTGGTAMNVTSLGRMCVAGNNGTHNVKIVSAATGADLAGASVPVSMAGCTAGQYQYAPLAGSVTLAAGTAYYLMSEEASGGDQWYDYSPVTPAAGTVDAPVYYTGTYNAVTSPGYSYVPVNFLYSASTTPPPSIAITSPAPNTTVSGKIAISATATAASGLTIANVQFKVNGNNVGGAIADAGPYTMQLDTTAFANGTYQLTAAATDSAGATATSAAVPVVVSNAAAPPPPPASGSPLITAQVFGALRNNFSGFVGMRFTTGAGSMAAGSLGRMCVAGNTGTHTIKLVKADGTDIAGASAAAAMTGCAPGSYQYAALNSAVQLAPNTTYYLVSDELSGGDQWYDYGPVTITPAARVDGPVYYASGYNLVASPGYSFVPLNLLYQ